MASSASESSNSAAVPPNVDHAAPGRSNGSCSSKPNLLTPFTNSDGPTVTAVWANGMLQLRRNTSARSPPQTFLP